jgi:multidrug efflux pump subunit AcrA (membrane-fusion protein)
VRKLSVASILIIAIAITIVVLARTDSEERPAASTPVVRAKPHVDRVVKATGVIKPMIGAEVRVGSRISGVVRRLFVHVGDTVREGQLLAELDDRDLVARRNEAQAALALAGANLDYAAPMSVASAS